MFGFTSPDQF